MSKILVFRNDRMGEFLLTIPALRALHETFGERITLVVDDYLRDLARCIEGVDEVLCWRNEKHSLRQIWNFSKSLQRRFNIAVVFNPSREAHLISFLARIPLRVGYDRKWGFLLNRKIPDRKDLGIKHEVEYNLELVGLIGAKTENKSLKIEIPPDKLREAQEMLQSQGILDDSYIVIHPFASYPPKQWPLERFLEVIKDTSVKINIVVIGGKENIFYREQFKNLSRQKQVAVLIGKTDLLQLAGILSGAKCLISNDSGPVHLASAVGTRCIVLFDNSVPSRSPRRWSPWGEGHIVIQKPDIRQITVEEVHTALKSFLE